MSSPNIGAVQAQASESSQAPNIGAVQTIPDPSAGGTTTAPLAMHHRRMMTASILWLVTLLMLTG